MRALRSRLSGLSCIAAALVAACAVFPDEAALTGQNAGASGSAGGLPGEAGEPGAGVAARAGEPSVPPLGGSPAAGGSSALGGVGGGSGGADVSVQAGAGGAEAPACASPKEFAVPTGLDLWMGAVSPSTAHGDELLLYVSGGSDERRTLFQVTVPAAPPGAELLEASIALRLESNADASLAARQLGLHLLVPLRAVSEANANWNRFGSNNGSASRWDTPGGDLGALVTQADIAAGTSSGTVRFDVTEAVRSVLDVNASVYGIVVLELGVAPAAPAELAFTSREGNASTSPALLLRYCEP